MSGWVRRSLVNVERNDNEQSSGADDWQAFLGFSGVLFGAFGAHLLRGFLEKSGTTQIWQTGVLYHLVHAVVLLILSGWRPVPRAAYQPDSRRGDRFQWILVCLGVDQFQMVRRDHATWRSRHVSRLVGSGIGRKGMERSRFEVVRANALSSQSSAELLFQLLFGFGEVTAIFGVGWFELFDLQPFGSGFLSLSHRF